MPRTLSRKNVSLGSVRNHLLLERLEERCVLSPTVGVYDENLIATNAVDFVAPGSTVTNTQFATRVANAFAQNSGGVIDGSVLGAFYEYGVNLNKTLRITPTENSWAIGQPGGGRAISGLGAFATSSASGTVEGFRRSSFAFSLLNAAPGEQVIEIGVTALSLTQRTYGNVTVTARLASGGSVSASRIILEANGQGDTFYGLTAPAGDYITGYTIGYDGPVVADVRLWFDDLGFITGVVTANRPPVANNDSYTVDEDNALGVAAPGVLSNDSDPDSNPLTAVLVSQPANGTLTFRTDGSFDYRPNANFNGVDRFSYRASDGSLQSALATVTLNVRPVNDAPVARNDSYVLNEDTPLSVPVPGVLANDADVDGDLLSALLVTGPSHGSLTLHVNGSFIYTPAANYNGPDSFSYRASDGALESAPATVSFTVNAVNDAPDLGNANFSLPENSPNNTLVGTIQGSDPDGDPLGYSLVGGNTGGAFAINPTTGQIRVANSAALDFETTPVFTLIVRATDPGQLFDEATVTVRLTDVPETIGALIDVRPGDSTNRINIRSRGKVDVAILSSATFDALQVDVNSLRFGRTGNEDSLSRNPAQGTPRFRVGDVNGDGRLDLVVEFETERTGFQLGDVRGILKGRTRTGQLFQAEDVVSIRDGGN